MRVDNAKDVCQYFLRPLTNDVVIAHNSNKSLMYVRELGSDTTLGVRYLYSYGMCIACRLADDPDSLVVVDIADVSKTTTKHRNIFLTELAGYHKQQWTIGILNHKYMDTLWCDMPSNVKYLRGE